MKELIMVYILIGFVIDVISFVGSIYSKKKIMVSSYFVLVLAFVEMLFIWPYVIFIYKPKKEREVSDE